MSVLRQLLAYFRGLLDRLFGRAKKEDPVVAPLVVALGLVGSDAVQTGGGGGESLITIVSVKNTAGSTKTNEIVQIPLPTPSTSFDGGLSNVAVYDDDGSGNLGDPIGVFQVDSHATDKAGKQRFALATVIVPSFTSTQNRKLRVYATSAAEPTGTAITAAAILATSFNIRVSYTIGGTTYTADATTALGGGTTFSKTAAWTRGTWRSGPCCTEIVCETPLQNGGTAHNSGDGLRAVFIISAFKAGAGAVDGGNPITYVYCDVVVENGAIDRTSVSDYAPSAASISRATSLSDGTLISTTDTDADGNTITYNYSSGFTHPYGERFSRPVHVGTKPTNIVAWGNVANAAAADNVMMDWLKSCGLCLNYQFTASDVTNASWSYDETVPFDNIGDFASSQGGSGERDEIGVFSVWEINALAKWDANGRRRVWGNAERLNYYYEQCYRRFTSPSAGAIGGYNRPDAEFYKNNNAFSGGTLIVTPGTWAKSFSQLDTGHEPNHCAAAYLMSGRYLYLDTLNGRCAAYSSGLDPAYAGTHGINKTLAGEATTTTGWAFQQMRSFTWSLRNLFLFALLTPDDKTDSKLCWPKSLTNSWLDNCYQKINDTTAANTNGGANWYGTTGPRFIWGGNGSNGVGSDNQFAPWQNGYLAHVLGLIKTSGMNNADLDAFVAWFGPWFVELYSNSDVVSDNLVAAYYTVFREYNDGSSPGAYITDYATFYQENALMVPGVGNGAGTVRRKPTGTLGLSATSGASVTVTLPSALLHTTWHIGGWIQAGSGRGRITAIDAGGDECTIDTTVTHGAAFASTSIAQSADDVAPAWTIPPARPADAPADGSLPARYNDAANPNYIDVYRAACAVMHDLGIAGADDAFAYAEAWLPGAATGGGTRKYFIEART